MSIFAELAMKNAGAAETAQTLRINEKITPTVKKPIRATMRFMPIFSVTLKKRKDGRYGRTANDNEAVIPAIIRP
jgi:hypothetical protein